MYSTDPGCFPSLACRSGRLELLLARRGPVCQESRGEPRLGKTSFMHLRHVVCPDSFSTWKVFLFGFAVILLMSAHLATFFTESTC
jgi:hypothetical protein